MGGGEVKFLVPFFLKKGPFLANIERCPKFLEYSFPEKVTPDIDFIDGAVVQCYVPVVKMLS